MINEWTMYWILIADSIRNTFVFLTVLSIMAILFGCLSHLCEDYKPGKSIAIAGLASLFTSVVFVTFIPSSKSLILIYSVPAIVNSQAGQEIPPLLLEYIKKSLTEEKK
jgi:hypothetical protein